MDTDIDMTSDDKENHIGDVAMRREAHSSSSPADQFDNMPPIANDEEYVEYRKEYDENLVLYRQKAAWLNDNCRVFSDLGNRLTKCNEPTERQAIKDEIRRLYSERINTQKAQLADVAQMDKFLVALKQRVKEYDRGRR